MTEVEIRMRWPVRDRLDITTAGLRPRLAAVGTANPPCSYTQAELLALYGIQDPRIRSIFSNSAIERRNLTLGAARQDGSRPDETQGQLLDKHREQGIDIGSRALQSCLKRTDATLDDLEYLCCVTSTGLLTPGFSALLNRELGLRRDCGRLDVVGMGCNAGLNALAAVAGWATANPGRLAAMVCIEVCSAAYVIDGTVRSGVVNSLFGDGAAAVAVIADPDRPPDAAGATDGGGATLLKHASVVIPEALAAMRFDWDDQRGKFSFFLDRDVPYVVGAHAEGVIGELLCGTGLRRSDIAHWVVHSGGKKVIDAIRINLGLTAHDLRNTTGVLRDHGNLSSGSFLFSYERLMEEGVVRPGDYGVLMTMGPGSTIETALVQW